MEVPLGEASEAYRVEILDGDEAVRVVDTGSPSFVYAATDQSADFGGPVAELSLRIRQMSATEGPGLAAERVVHV